MDVSTNRSTEEAMQMLRDYLVHNAPVRGHVYRNGSQVSFREYLPEQGNLFDSGKGIALIGCLTLITGGVFVFIYIAYLLIFKDKTAATIEAVAFESEGRATIISISSNKKKYERQVTGWAQANL